jgi:hypothetical protein
MIIHYLIIIIINFIYPKPMIISNHLNFNLNLNFDFNHNSTLNLRIINFLHLFFRFHLIIYQIINHF